VFEPKWRVLQRAPIVKRIALPAVLMIRCDYEPTTGFAAVQGDRPRSWERVVAEPSRTGVSLRAVIRGKWCVSKFDFPKWCVSKFGEIWVNLVPVQIRLSKFGSVCGAQIVCVQIWFTQIWFQIRFNLVCVQIWLLRFGVCPDLVGVQIWLLVGSLAKLLCGASVPGDWLGSDFLSALAGREPQLSSGAAASGFFLLNAERRRSHRWKGTPSFGNCLAQSRRTRPVSSSLSDCRKSGDALDVIRLREHVEWLDLFTPILVFFEPQKVADQRFGITGNVHDAPRSQPHDS
jgi:hypothetical protein